VISVIVLWGIIETNRVLPNSIKPQDSKPWGFCFIKVEMTNEQDIVSFQKKLEERNFIFSDGLLEQLLKGKMERLREQSKELEKLRSMKRHK
jgi:hypothetical protein